ncbi:hypothetical protein BH23ACT5_BH23ACT5_15440 [soil metagenome]
MSYRETPNVGHATRGAPWHKILVVACSLVVLAGCGDGSTGVTEVSLGETAQALTLAAASSTDVASTYDGLEGFVLTPELVARLESLNLSPRADGHVTGHEDGLEGFVLTPELVSYLESLGLER